MSSLSSSKSEICSTGLLRLSTYLHEKVTYDALCYTDDPLLAERRRGSDHLTLIVIQGIHSRVKTVPFANQNTQRLPVEVFHHGNLEQ